MCLQAAPCGQSGRVRSGTAAPSPKKLRTASGASNPCQPDDTWRSTPDFTIIYCILVRNALMYVLSIEQQLIRAFTWKYANSPTNYGDLGNTEVTTTNFP
jgi:hypothetical protein